MAGVRSRVANDRTAVATVRVSRPYQSAVRDMWNDAMRYPILSRPFSCGITMEPTRVGSSVRGGGVRYICANNPHSAHAATADPRFDAARENIFACLSDLCARVKLDL